MAWIYSGRAQAYIAAAADVEGVVNVLSEFIASSAVAAVVV